MLVSRCQQTVSAGIFSHDQEDSEAAALEKLAESTPAVHSIAAQRQVRGHQSMRVYFSEVQLAQLDGERVELGAGGWGKVSSFADWICLSSPWQHSQDFPEAMTRPLVGFQLKKVYGFSSQSMIISGTASRLSGP